MHGETKEAKEHAHTWEVVKFNNELIGKTNTFDDHFHILAIHSTDKFAAGITLQTSEVDGHSHEVVIPENLLAEFRRLNLRIGPRDGTGPLGGTDICPVNKRDGYQDDVYGPDGSDEEEDEKKRKKQKIDEDGEIEDRNLRFQGKFTKVKWDFSTANYSIEQLRASVTAAMRAWGDKQGGKKGDYKLPYKMPDGTVNVNGVRNALARASQVKGAPSATIQKAVSELQRVLAAAKKAGFGGEEEDEDKKKFEDRAAIVERLRAKYADDSNVEIHDDHVFVRNQHLFQVGTWNGIEITPQKILQMSENFLKLKNSFLPAIKAGHDTEEHRRQFGELSLGWVHNAHSALPFMDGDLEFPLDVFDKIINPGKLRFKSIETFTNLKRNGKNYDEVLFALALLGVNPPALADLGPVVQPFSDNTCKVVCIDFDNGGEDTMSTEDKKKDEGTQKFQDEIAKLKKELADKSKVNETLTGERDTFAQAATHYSAQLRAKDAQMFADTLKTAGKLTKAQEPMFRSLFLTMDDSKKLEFQQDDGSKKDMSQVEMFRDLFESLAPQVDLKEGATEGDQNPDVPDPDASQKKEGLVEECAGNVKGAAKFTDKAKRSGWKFAGNDINDQAIALQEKSGLNDKGKYVLEYGDALAHVYAQRDAEKK